jgi:hypothetical protein
MGSQWQFLYRGSFHNIVILTRKEQAWRSQRDIEIRFAFSSFPHSDLQFSD